MRTPYLFPDGARFGADNLFLHAKARRHRVDDFAGPLSIKTVLNGAVTWRVAGRNLVVDADSFLVLGEGEKYSMDLDEPRAVETACAFFRGGYVAEIARDATTRLETALDDPARPALPLPYLSRLHRDSKRSILDRVQNMALRCVSQIQPSGFEEDFLLLSKSLLLRYEQIRRQVARVPALKASTREELFRRIETGREYLHGHVDQPVSLEEMSRVACLSRYHFHRTFTQTYRKTPHTYLTELRLSRARSLLGAGWPVSDVCDAVGFSGHSTFARLFRSHYGVTPSAFRKSGK